MSNVILDLFKEVEQDFGIEIAIKSLMIQTIMLSTKPKRSEISGEKSFGSRVKKKCKNLLWEVSDEDFEVCWNIVEATPSWRVGREMCGLGGSVSMKMRDLLTPIKEKESEPPLSEVWW